MRIIRFLLVITVLVFCWTGAMASEKAEQAGQMQPHAEVRMWILVLTLVISSGLYAGVRSALKNMKLAVTLGLVSACIGVCFLLVYCMVSSLSNAVFSPVGAYSGILPELPITIFIVVVLFLKWELLLVKVSACLAMLRF